MNADAVTPLVEQLRGQLIPAVPVPFDGRGINADAQRRYAHWMAGQPVGGAAVWVHTGRGLFLTAGERAEVLETWRDEAPDLPIICGVGVPRGEDLPADPRARTDRTTQLTVQMAEAARDGGAAAVMVHPPEPLAALPDADSRVVELHRAVAAAGIPVIAFHLYKAASGLPYTPDLVERLLQVDGVIGIKLATLDSVMDYQELSDVVLGSGSLLITGEDRFLGYSLMMNAEAALVGLGAACTDLTAGLLAAWFARRHPEFIALSAQVDEFARVTFTQPMEGYVQRMLWALEADGVIPEGARDPFGPELPAGEQEWVRDAVGAMRET